MREPIFWPMLRKTIFLSLAVSAIYVTAHPHGATIAQWMDFKQAAVSIVFDDNSANQFEVAEPLMNARGIRGTFFVVNDWSATVWDSIQSASRLGHEIGSHTITHPDMSALGDSDLAAAERELKDSRDSIEKRIPGRKCLTFAWPFNRYNAKVEALAAKYYISARQGEGVLEVASPKDMFATRSVPFADTAEQMNRIADTAIMKNRWLIELLHRVHPEPYSLTYTIDDSLRMHLDYLVSKRDSLWIAPYGEVVRYIKERDSSSLSLQETSDSALVYKLVHPLDDSVYDLPLSLEIPLEEDAQVESVSQGADSLPFQIAAHGEDRTIRLAARPNAGGIVIRGSNLRPRQQPVWVIEHKTWAVIGEFPGERNRWYFRPPFAGVFTLKAFNSAGKPVVREYAFRASPGYTYELRTQSAGFPRGRTLFAIYSGGKLVAKRPVTFR
jgi:peptidoglycan/xylan/chitin deacetylase (PgdA/CDA1 family)